MTTKDWILLFVPLIANLLFDGVLIFILNKIFENKQRIHSIKIEYAASLRQKIDTALMLHAQATRLANEGNPNNDVEIDKCLRDFVSACLDTYYYYVQNKSILQKLDSLMEKLASNILSAVQETHKAVIDSYNFSALINQCRDNLIELKELSIKV